MRNTLLSITQLISHPLRSSALGRSALGRKLSDESGVGTIEMVLLLVVLIALVLLFKTHIKSLLDLIMLQIEQSSKSVWAES